MIRRCYITKQTIESTSFGSVTDCAIITAMKIAGVESDKAVNSYCFVTGAITQDELNNWTMAHPASVPYMSLGQIVSLAYYKPEMLPIVFDVSDTENEKHVTMEYLCTPEESKIAVQITEDQAMADYDQ